MCVLNHTGCLDAVAVDVVLEFAEQRLRVVEPTVRGYLLPVSLQGGIALPRPVGAPLPLPPSPFRDCDFEEDVVSRGVVGHNRGAKGVLRVHIQGKGVPIWVKKLGDGLRNLRIMTREGDEGAAGVLL